MPARKKVDKPYPFIIADTDGYARSRGSTEEAALRAAATIVSTSNHREIVGIYKLVKIVRVKPSPVEVEAVSL